MTAGLRPLFVAGPARGGTTLAAKMLDAHGGIALASDALLPLFRSMRNAFVRRALPAAARPSFDPGGPLEDYYFTEERIRMLDAVQDGDLSAPFEAAERADLLEAIRRWAVHESADILPRLETLRGGTYLDLIEDFLRVVAETRGASAGDWVGTKEVWSVEFFRPIARAYPDAKFLLLLRDPRAAVHSMLGVGRRDPSQASHVLSFARHCRKCVAYGIRYGRDPLFDGRLLVLRYERLLAEPEAAARDVCRFLEVDFDPAMVDPRRWIDRSTGGVWKGNSGFRDVLSGIDRARADGWRVGADPRAIATVNLVCAPEMRWAGYDPDDPGLRPDPAVLAYLTEIAEAPWSWRTDLGDPRRDYGHELLRRALLALPSGAADRSLVRRSFLFAEAYEALRDLLPPRAAEPRPSVREVWACPPEPRASFDVDVDVGKPLDVLGLKRTSLEGLREAARGLERSAAALYAEGRPAEEVLACPCCGADAAAAAEAVRVFGVSYRRCPACGHAFVRRRPPVAAMTAHFEASEDLSSPYTDSETLEARMEQVVRPKLEWVRRAYRRHRGRDAASVLDVGAGGGQFTATCRRAGLRAEGYEISAPARRFARDALGVDLRADDFLTASDDEVFDVVTLWGLLEYVHEPRAFLRAARRRLDPRAGMLVVEVPRFDSLSTAAQAVNPAGVARHLDPGSHIQVFSETSLASALRASGLRPVSAWLFGMDAYETVVQIGLLLDWPTVLEELGPALPGLQAAADSDRLCDDMIVAAVPDE